MDLCVWGDTLDFNKIKPRAENWINQEIKTEGGKTLLLIAIGNEVSIKQISLNYRLERSNFGEGRLNPCSGVLLAGNGLR